jgi:hypothetical protein
MAKRKTKTKKRRTTPMAAPKRKRRRRTSSTTKLRRSLSARSAAPRRRRRRRGLSDGMTKGNLVKSLKSNGGAALGGLGYLGLSFIPVGKYWYVRNILGGGIAIGTAWMGAPNIASGMTGANAYDLGRKILLKMNVALNDDMGDDLEDTEYVDPATLQDTGMEDQEGNPVVMDDDNILYALSDGNELTAIGDAQNMPGAGMILQDNPYALSDNPYSLNDGY